MDIKDFEVFVASVPAREGPFEPFAIRDDATRTTEVFLSNEAFHGRYICPHLTLYIGERSGAVVGFIAHDGPCDADGKR